MKNPFKKYKVAKETTIVYDTYKQGSYTRNKTVTVKKDTVIYGDKVSKGDKEFVSFDAAELGVDELIQIPADCVEKQTPWGIIATFVVLVCGVVVWIVKRNK